MARFVNGILRELMQPVRELLFVNLLERIQTELGSEETLRLLWSFAVGPQLAANARLRAIRGNTLLIVVPDRTWKNSLRSLEKMILEAANRFWKEPLWEVIEFVEDPRGFAPMAKAPAPRITNPLNVSSEHFVADRIPDTELRRMFLESAQKYFAWQEDLGR